MLRPGFTLAAIATLVSTALAVPAIGDKAPPIQINKWLTTAPAALPGDKDAGKFVYLIEFWATWCGPCRLSIPHLADLHRDLAKTGVTIIGISSEDPAIIEKFLAKPKTGKPIDMPYHVGADKENKTNAAWMLEDQGIPHAFVVDKSGIIVWTGHPMDPDMPRALKGAVAGTYNTETGKAAAAAAKKYDELLEKARSAAEQYEKDRANGETPVPTELFKIIDDMASVKPHELMPLLMKRHFLGELDRMEDIIAIDAKVESVMKDNPEALQQVIEFQFERSLAERNPGLMLRVARRLEQLTEGKDTDALALLARVYCELGMIDAAIVAQERAIAAAPADDQADLKRVLQYYKSAKDMASTAAKSP
ncbi:MAG: TlpA family protein disulfide reductase [Planctomycetes bacterium]|nr:TlpA family protein disulfide reductase [Planctomycetota bacterium]